MYKPTILINLLSPLSLFLAKNKIAKIIIFKSPSEKFLEIFFIKNKKNYKNS